MKALNFQFCHMLINFAFVSQVLSDDTPIDRTSEFLNNMKLTHWDDWGTSANCGQLFIVSMRIRQQNGSTVTGIDVGCSDEIHPANKVSRIANLGRSGGVWGPLIKCKAGFAVGISFALNTDASSGSSITKMEMHCSDDPETQNIKDTGGRRDPKEYSQFCETGDALVGINFKADSIITFQKGDTASVKGVSIDCKIVKNPAIHQPIEYVWEKRRRGMRCNETDLLVKLSELNPAKNSSATISINCTFDAWTGVGPSSSLQNSDHAVKVYSSMGLNNNREFVKWALLKRLMKRDLKLWFLKKFPEKPRLLDDFAAERLWSDKKNYTGELSVTLKHHPIAPNFFKKLRQEGKLVLKHDPAFEQFVGNCGIYQIAFSLFRSGYKVYFEQPVKKRMTRFVFETL